ncbi:glycosyltransferase [Hufsiella ginkgonis]|uniref:Glycosyltransferase n=1 Tax=Hufsiella ginkgonis TaxID=2695274 RepID=A0A7K1Y0B8_9SPHI|nr:glycosyltransferase [Hufsiella ginkgonis]MXV16675.1 glycosyltransferase [Hufsiella ginkgonis]
MKISVVVPTYNRPELLSACLHALTRQDFPSADFEIIVVLDGAETISQYPVKSQTYLKSCYYLKTFENKGPAAARNRGWLRAKGVLIAFTDDDCLPAPDWLSKLWEGYSANEGANNGIAFTGRVIVPVTGPVTDHALNTKGLENGRFVTANCACSKQALLKTGGFDERFKMAWREDSDLEFKLLTHKVAVVRLEDAVVTHPVRQVAWGSSLREQKKGMYNALLYKKYPVLYNEKIGQRSPFSYYLMILLLVATAGLFLTRTYFYAGVSMACWTIVWLLFCLKRLRRTSHNPPHLAEIAVTSAAIPFASVFWHWYGALKFRVFFI